MNYLLKTLLSWILELLNTSHSQLDIKSSTYRVRKVIEVVVFIASLAGNLLLLRAMFVLSEEHISLKAKMAAECVIPNKPKE